MKFLTQIITLSKSQYAITNKPTIWQKLPKILSALIVWLKILAIVCLSLHSGFEHLNYVLSRQLTRQLEIIAVNLMTALIAPKGRAYA